MLNKRIILEEHNDLITAQYDMPASEQDIFALVLSQIKKEDPPEKRYRVLVKDIVAITQKQVDYTKVEKSAKKLLSRVCTIIRDNGDPLYTSMISDAEHIRGSGYIEIGVSSKLRPYLVDLKANFTRYQLRMFGALRSKYSKRIYKMLSQFKNTGIMRISVEELKTRLKLLDPKTGREAFKTWTIFANKVLEVAKQEINEFTDIRCAFKAHKTKRKFTHLEFKIARVPLEQLEAKHGEDQTAAELRKRLIDQFKLSQWQAADIIIHVPEKEIRKTFHEISVQLSDRRVKNIGGYAAKIFDNKYNLGFFEGAVSSSMQKKTPLDITKRSAPAAHREASIPSIGALMEKVLH